MSDRARTGADRSVQTGATTTPRFSVRVQRGRASLSLSQPLAFAGGRIEVLEIDVGTSARAVDLSRGWRALMHRRGVATAARVALDGEALASRVQGLRIVGSVARGWLVTLARPHAHVAFELSPVRAGLDVGLLVAAARSALDGPRPPTAEAFSIASELGARFDPERGVLCLDDPLLEALTEALVPHGMRVPALPDHQRALPEIRGGELVLGLEVEAPSVPAPDRHSPAITSALSALVEGRYEAAREHVAGRRERAAEALFDELSLEAGALEARGGLDAPSSALWLRHALRGSVLDEIAAAARALDGHERAAAVAVDGLLAAAARARSLDPAVEAELLGRALARAPDDPRVLATSAPLPEPASVGPLLRSLERAAAVRGRDVGVEWGAIGRLRAHGGDARGAVEAYERAVRAAPADAALAEELAAALARGGRSEAAARAFSSAADRHAAAGDRLGEARALFSAAQLEHRSGRVREALELAQRARAGAAGALRAELEDGVAGWALEAGDEGARAAAEHALVALADQGEPSTRIPVADALARALGRSPSRAMLEALARLWPEHPALRASREALERAAFAEIEGAPPRERADVARRLAERLRAEGRLREAALALVRTGELLGDAATLRAAVDLAERAGDLDALEQVLERALRIVGDGPAREALERRRPPRR